MQIYMNPPNPRGHFPSLPIARARAPIGGGETRRDSSINELHYVCCSRPTRGRARERRERRRASHGALTVTVSAHFAPLHSPRALSLSLSLSYENWCSARVGIHTLALSLTFYFNFRTSDRASNFYASPSTYSLLLIISYSLKMTRLSQVNS